MLAAFLFVEDFFCGVRLTILSQETDLSPEEAHEYLQLPFAPVALCDMPGHGILAKGKSWHKEVAHAV